MKIIICFLLFFAVAKCFAQQYEEPVFEADSLNEPDSLPAFKYYTIKDNLPFTPNQLKKGLPVLFIYFSPDCDHCQHEVDAIKKNIDELKGVQIVMVSRQSKKEIWNFYNLHRIREYPIVMLMDTENSAHKMFDFNFIPMIRLYNARWKRIAAYNQQAPVARLIENFKKRK